MHLLFESSSDEVETDICWFLVFKLKRQSSTHRVTKNFFSKIYFGADFQFCKNNFRGKKCLHQILSLFVARQICQITCTAISNQNIPLLQKTFTKQNSLFEIVTQYLIFGALIPNLKWSKMKFGKQSRFKSLTLIISYEQHCPMYSANQPTVLRTLE